MAARRRGTRARFHQYIRHGIPPIALHCADDSAVARQVAMRKIDGAAVACNLGLQQGSEGPGPEGTRLMPPPAPSPRHPATLGPSPGANTLLGCGRRRRPSLATTERPDRLGCRGPGVPGPGVPGRAAAGGDFRFCVRATTAVPGRSAPAAGVAGSTVGAIGHADLLWRCAAIALVPASVPLSTYQD